MRICITPGESRYPQKDAYYTEDAVLDQAHKMGVIRGPAVRSTCCTTICLCYSISHEQEVSPLYSLINSFNKHLLYKKIIKKTPALYEPQCSVGSLDIVSQGSSRMIIVNKIWRLPSALICDNFRS